MALGKISSEKRSSVAKSAKPHFNFGQDKNRVVGNIALLFKLGQLRVREFDIEVAAQKLITPETSSEDQTNIRNTLSHLARSHNSLQRGLSSSNLLKLKKYKIGCMTTEL
ncbi:MAG: hypothetical protein WCG05_04570 [Alphaproteobacteria bacterium]